MTAGDINGPTPALRVRRKRHSSAPRIVRLALKELRETLRDRRTVATLLLMPILVYPLLSVAFQRLLFSNMKAITGRGEFVIGFRSDADGAQIGRILSAGTALLDTRDPLHGPGSRQKNLLHKDDPAHKPIATKNALSDASEVIQTADADDVRGLVVDDLRRAVIDGRVDVSIQIRKTEPFPIIGETSKAIDCGLIFDRQSPASRAALYWVKDRLQAVNEHGFELQLQARGVRSRTAMIVADDQPIEESVEMGSRPASPSLATLIPLILILMTITGAVYPAIDLTAGERERGTLEILIAAPVPRMQLLLAKYVAVLTVALLTALVNLAAMIATILSTGQGKLIFGDAGISINALVAIVALLVLFAAFFSAVLLAVTSFARSFKEAQAYLIPLMLASIAPGVLSMIPGLQLSGPLVVTPLVNIVLLARDLLRETVEPATALWVVISTGFFALAAIGVAARIFGTDDILYDTQGTWSDMFRRPRKPSEVPTPTSALLSLAILFPAYFLTSNLLAQVSVLSIEWRMVLGALVTILVFFQIPLAIAVFNRVDISTGFQLCGASPFVFVGAVVLGISLWPFAHEALVLLKWLGITSFDSRTLEAARELVEKIQAVSPVLLVVTLAIVPALCEEFFFRGFLLAALRKSLSQTRAVVLSSVLFGVFHVVAIEQLHFERLVPSTLLGLVLGWLCVRCGSALPGMLLHASHNSLLLLAAHYQKELASWGWGLDQSTDLETAGLPASWLIAALAGTVFGAAVVAIATRRIADMSALKSAN